MKKIKIIGILILILFLLGCQTIKEQYSLAGNKYVLNNGLTIMTKANKNTDLVVIDLFIKTGTLTEEKNGISYLTTKTILTGTKNYNKKELIDFLEKEGGNFEVIPSVQYNEIRITVPSTAISTGLKFLFEILTQAEFNVEEIEKEKTNILNEIKQKKDNPQAISDELLFSKLFSGTTYAKPVEGTEESINSITYEEIIEYYQNFYTPNNMVLVIAGNINENAIKKTIEKFSVLKKKEIKTKKIIFQEYEPQQIEENQFIESYYVNIGYRTVPAKHPDTVKLKALHGVLGQGPASRLFYRLREKQGLAYRLETLNPTIKDTGLFKISTITRPEMLNKTISEILKQVEILKQEKISAQELKEVKSQIKGYYALFHQLSSDITEYLGLYEVTGKGYDWDYEFPKAIEMITAEDIQETARKYLNDPVITIVGPFEEVEIKSVS